MRFMPHFSGVKKQKNYTSGSSDTSEATSEDTPTRTPNRTVIKNISDSASSSPCLTPRKDADLHSHKILPSPVKNQNQVRCNCLTGSLIFFLLQNPFNFIYFFFYLFESRYTTALITN